MWWILFMGACALELGDYYTAGFWEKYAYPIATHQGNNLYSLADGRAQTIGHKLTCNKMGQLKVLPDPMLQAAADRTTEIQATLAPEDIVSIRFSKYNVARIGRHWGDALQRSHEAVVGDSAISPLNLTGLSCIAPANQIWGQGPGELDQGKQVVIDQAELNVREGNRYAARSNPETSFVEVEIAHPGDNGLDPARMSWVALSLAAQYQRLYYVNSDNLIGLWWMNEKGGTTVTDYSTIESDGTAANVTFDAYEGVDFEPAPRFNGSTSDVDVFSAALASAFNGAAGTVCIWVKATEVALVDGAYHYAVRIYAGAINYIAIILGNTDNHVGFTYYAGGTPLGISGSISDTKWHLLTMTWDVNAGGSGEFKAFIDEQQVGNTQTGLGTWSGAITVAELGTYNSGSLSWLGSLELAALFTAALSPAQIANLSRKDAIRGPDGETFAGERFLLLEKNIRYDLAKKSRRVFLSLEREVTGTPALTYTVPS